ncbi:MAG: hypothetical protein ACR2RB_05505 [Gammaproteobacteria bacterium]
MIRIVAGILIAPLFWPWVLHPVMTLAYIALTGTTISYSWLAPLHNLHLLWWPYALIIVFGVPFVYFSLKRKLRSVLPYLVTGAIIGFLGPALFYVGLGLFGSTESDASLSELVLILLQSDLHFVTGSTVASGAMLVVYWAIGVRGNVAYGITAEQGAAGDVQTATRSGHT